MTGKGTRNVRNYSDKIAPPPPSSLAIFFRITLRQQEDLNYARTDSAIVSQFSLHICSLIQRCIVSVTRKERMLYRHDNGLAFADIFQY
jgi:hypothetical protein